MGKFTIIQPMTFKNEVIIKDTSTNKLYKAEFSFNTDNKFTMSKDRKTITFNLRDDGFALYHLEIKEEYKGEFIITKPDGDYTLR